MEKINRIFTSRALTYVSTTKPIIKNAEVLSISRNKLQALTWITKLMYSLCNVKVYFFLTETTFDWGVKLLFQCLRRMLWVQSRSKDPFLRDPQEKGFCSGLWGCGGSQSERGIFCTEPQIPQRWWLKMIASITTPHGDPKGAPKCWPFTLIWGWCL